MENAEAIEARLRRQLDDADQLNGELLRAMKGLLDGVEQLHADIVKLEPLYLWEPDEPIRAGMVAARRYLLAAGMLRPDAEGEKT